MSLNTNDPRPIPDPDAFLVLARMPGLMGSFSDEWTQISELVSYEDALDFFADALDDATDRDSRPLDYPHRVLRLVGCDGSGNLTDAALLCIAARILARTYDRADEPRSGWFLRYRRRVTHDMVDEIRDADKARRLAVDTAARAA